MKQGLDTKNLKPEVLAVYTSVYSAVFCDTYHDAMDFEGVAAISHEAETVASIAARHFGDIIGGMCK